MNYTINKAKRNIFIIASTYLILYFIISGFAFLYEDLRKLDTIRHGIIKIIYIIAYAYLFLSLIDYFKFYKLKILMFINIIILICGVVMEIFYLIIHYITFIPISTITIILSLIQFLFTVLWLIFLYKIKAKDYIALQSIRKSAISFILASVLGILITIAAYFSGLAAYYELRFILFAIPYFYFIEFVLKVKLKQQTK